jgi:hypothetical protein
MTKQMITGIITKERILKGVSDLTKAKKNASQEAETRAMKELLANAHKFLDTDGGVEELAQILG